MEPDTAMSWITIVWSMASAVCATLALIHLAIWAQRRSQVTHLLFALTALGAVGNAVTELGMMKATTVEAYAIWLRISFVPTALLVVSFAFYVRKFFGTGRLSLATAVTVLWTVLLIVDGFSPFSPIFSEIFGLRIVQTPWGEPFAVAKGVISPLNYVNDVANVSFLLFVMDASLTLWRRGQRRRAVLGGGVIVSAIVAAIFLAHMTDAGVLRIPYLVTFIYVGTVIAVGYPLIGDVLRAAQLTRQLQASEASLRESEERFRFVADSAPVLIWMSGVDKLCTFFNKPWLEFTGRTLEQEMGNGWAEGVHPDDLQRCLKTYVGAFDGREPFVMQYRLRRHDGEYRWISDTGVPRYDAQKNFAGYIGSCMDVTERKQAEEKFRLVVEASPNGIVLVNQRGHIVLVNSQTEKLFGYAREELLGQSVEILVPDRFRSVHPTYRGQFLAVPKARAMGAGRELFARRKDCTEFPVEIGISPIETADGVFVLSAIVDITARKKAELAAQQHRAELAHLSRVTLMGEMSASLAHELNQPLSGIVSNAAAGQRFIDRGDADLKELRELLADISADGRRAGDVVRGIRSMVKKEQTARRRVNLNEVVMDAVQIISPDALLRSCELKTSLESNLPVIEGDPVQLQQVLLNLVINAFDAMRDTPVRYRKVVIATKSNGDGGGARFHFTLPAKA